MTSVFHLVRHAAHDEVGRRLAGRLDGYALGREGRAQAARLAQRMEAEQISAVHVSPRERTHATASAIAEVCVVPLKIEAALDELDFGRWSGLDFETLESDPDWRRWNTVRSISQTPAGDTMRAAQIRVVDLLERLHLEGPQSPLVLVSHADVIKAAIFYYLGMSIDRYDAIDISPASISTLELGAWRARITRLNETVS